MRFLNVLCCCCFKLQKNPSQTHTKKKVWRYRKSAPQVQRGVWIQENFLRCFLWWYKVILTHLTRIKFTEVLSVKNSSSCGSKPHPSSVPGMSHIPFVSSCLLAWSRHHYKYWHWCHQYSLKMSFLKTLELFLLKWQNGETNCGGKGVLLLPRLEVPLLRQVIKILFQVQNIKSDLCSIQNTNYLWSILNWFCTCFTLH